MWRSSQRRVGDAAALADDATDGTAGPALPATATAAGAPAAAAPLPLRSWPVDGVEVQGLVRLEVGVSSETLPQLRPSPPPALAVAATATPADLHIDVEEEDAAAGASGVSVSAPLAHIPPTQAALVTPPPPHARRIERPASSRHALVPQYPRSPSANCEPTAAAATEGAVVAPAPAHAHATAAELVGEDEAAVVAPRLTPTPTPTPTTPRPSTPTPHPTEAAELEAPAPVAATATATAASAPSESSVAAPKPTRTAHHHHLNAKLRAVTTLKRMAAPMLVPLQAHERAKQPESRQSGNSNRPHSDSISVDDSAGLGSHRLLTGSTRVAVSRLGAPSPKNGQLALPLSGAHNRVPSLERPDVLQGSSPGALGLLSLDRTVLKRGDDVGADGGGDDGQQTRGWWGRIISPDARPLFFWRLLIMLFTLYNAVVIPYRLAFGGLPYGAPAQAVSFSLDHVGDALFLLDMVVQARTGYVHHGVKQLGAGLVWRRYMRGWFLLDLAASLPFDLLQLQSMRLMPAVRLPKLLRLAKLGVLEELVEHLPLFKAFQAPLIVLYISHLAGCGYMGIARYEGVGSSPWLVSKELASNGDATFVYLSCLFWSYALLTDRDNEGVTPETTLQSLFTLALMLLGMLGFALVVGNVSSAVEAANEKMKEFQGRVAFVARFMSCFEVAPALRHQVKAFYEYTWARDRGFDLPAVLEQLPDVLTTDISMFLLQDIVQRVELFAGLDTAFVPALINRMHPAVYLPGESVCTQGDAGQAMYFLQSGEVDVLKAHSSGQERLLHTLPTGSSFGEYSLILPTQRTASVRAVGFCTVYVLSRENFEEVLRVFPKCAAVVRARAKAHHAATIRREQQLLREKGDHNTPATGTALSATSATTTAGGGSGTDDASRAAPAEAEIVRLVLQNKQNAKEYRKKISVYAFRVDSPVEVHKSWGLSKCAAGDWLVIGGESDAYTVGHELFTETYESIPQGAAHTYRKKGTVLAAQVARPLRVQTSKELLVCNAGDFLVQDEKLNQYCVPMASFQATYDPCVEKVATKRAALLDANSAAIRALKGRGDDSKMAHIDPRVILPSSLFWQIWQTAVSCVTLYNLFMLPFRWAFIFHSTHPAMLFFDYTGDALLLLDIYFRFRVAFLRDGALVTDLSQIRQHYRATWFVYDLLAALPLDFAMIAIGMQPLLRVGRLLKLYSLHLMSSELIRNSGWAASLHLGRMMFAFVLLSHWTASLFWSFTYFEEYEDEDSLSHWLPSRGLEGADLTAQYLRAQYFAFVALTGFCGVDVPNTSAEAIFSILIIMVGFFVVSLVIGEITSIVSNMDHFAAEHQRRSVAVEQFLHHHKLPLGLQERVRRFLAHEWNVQRGADPNKALHSLPPMLRLQVQMQISGDAVRRTPFFQAADATLLAVVSALTFETYPGGETIFVAGQIGDKVYIVNRGLVAIRLPSKEANAPPLTVKTVGKGSVFGETALLKNGRRTASAIAETSCDLMVIAKKDFLKIISDDPEFAEQLRAITDTRLQSLNALKRRRAAMSAAVRSHTSAASAASAAGLGRKMRHASMFVLGEEAPIALRSSSNANANDGGATIQMVAVGPTNGPTSRPASTRPPGAGIGGGGSVSAAATPRHKQRSGSDGQIGGALNRSFTLMTTARDQRNMLLLRRSKLQTGALSDSEHNDQDEEDEDEESASDPEVEAATQS